MRSIFLPAARQDILQQYAYYVEQGVPAAADRFLEAVSYSIDSLMAAPDAGAPRVLGHPQLAGLRSWRVRGFEDIRLYYLVRQDVLQIIRVLHGRRDVGAMFERGELSGG